MAKPKAPKKTAFEKAAEMLNKVGSKFDYRDFILIYHAGGIAIEFVSADTLIVATAVKEHGSVMSDMRITDTTDVGDVLQFIHKTIAANDPSSPPTKLGGKEFEELLLNEARRIEKGGALTMGRYGVMVSMVENEWMPIPSLPDFEGVRRDGTQFIIEAKVCSQPSFRMQSDKIKHKQVRHMLKRSLFGVDCYVLIHFNDRLGATFYDPPFTVAVRVCHADAGGWEVWEQFAECKDKNQEFPVLTREMAAKIGTPVSWHVPPRSTNLRPDLLGLIGDTYDD